MIKILLSSVSLTLASISLNAQIVNIPDANFKAYLVGNTAINTNSDNEIQVSEAEAFVGGPLFGYLNCSNQNISDLTGIEAFINLSQLSCDNNQLTSIDVSQNTALVSLEVDGNQLANLDISQNTALYFLSCSDNPLTGLNVANGNNTNFTWFDAENNPSLTCIQVDDVSYSTTNWPNRDPGASFSLVCSSSASINENASIELSIFPNPAKETLTIGSSSMVLSHAIYDLTGKLAQTGTEKSINVSKLRAGVYFIEIKTDKGIVQQKFIKE